MPFSSVCQSITSYMNDTTLTEMRYSGLSLVKPSIDMLLCISTARTLLCTSVGEGEGYKLKNMGRTLR